MSTATFYGNGKLLISGEYAVLDGALALALPTKFGQRLEVSQVDTGKLHWQSYDADKSCWLQAVFALPGLEILATTDIPAAERLLQILEAVREENPGFLTGATGIQATTSLSFPRNWGLGTSSTLLYTISEWAGVNPYTLLAKTFGGSGYDIACAAAAGPLFFQLQDGTPRVELLSFSPEFTKQLFFVYLNQKQSSQSAIAAYKAKSFDTQALIGEISSLTREMASASSLSDFEALLFQHERLLSDVLDSPMVKTELFPDYFGAVKSLGAWGGDFVLATGNEKTPDYFKARGYPIVLSYEEMILSP